MTAGPWYKTRSPAYGEAHEGELWPWVRHTQSVDETTDWHPTQRLTAAQVPIPFLHGQRKFRVIGK
jgi:hypothetical protein